MPRKNKQNHCIAIDIMGSDSSPDLIIDAAIQWAESSQSAHSITLIGASQHQSHFLKSYKTLSVDTKLDYLCSKTTIEMDEDPLKAVRNKKDSSLCLGMQLIKDNKADAFISAGNTGAMLASAKTFLSPLPNVLRPALLATLPSKNQPFAVLDVGANVNYKSEHLVQFAKMGAAFQKSQGNSYPAVGLLNIGTEENKGSLEIRKAYKTLQKIDKDFRFIGNIEGKDVFNGEIDVLVTNGFTGNVFLKTLEGFSGLLLDRIEKNISKEKVANFSHNLKKYLHYSDYPGGLLIGVNGLVIKCHGYSSKTAIKNAILGAIDRLEQNLLQSIRENLK